MIEPTRKQLIATAVEYEILQAMDIKKDEYDGFYFCKHDPKKWENGDVECSYGGFHSYDTQSIPGLVMKVLEKFGIE